MSIFHSMRQLLYWFVFHTKQQWCAGDELEGGGGGRKGQNGAPHIFQFSFNILEMCRKVQEFGSTLIYIYLSVAYCVTFKLGESG